MKAKLNKLLKKYPKKVKYKKITDFDNYDLRMSSLDCIFCNLFGNNLKDVDFIPDEKPSKDEILAWIWLVNPDLSNDIIPEVINEEFSKLLKCYTNDEMDEFWAYITDEAP